MSLKKERYVHLKRKPNQTRMDAFFKRIVSIPSFSTKEEQFITFLEEHLQKAHMKVEKHTFSNEKYGLITNVVATLEGNKEKEPIFISTHLDTVSYDSPVQIVEDASNYYSDGSTILGADPKMAITCMYELISLLYENNANHRTIQFIFTSAEELGCIGANYLMDTPMIANNGYVIDHDGQVGTIVHAAYSHAFVTMQLTSKTNDGISRIAKQIIKQVKSQRVFDRTVLSTRSLQTDIQEGMPVVRWEVDLYGETDEALAVEMDHLHTLKQMYKMSQTFQVDMAWEYSINGYHVSLDDPLVQSAVDAMKRINIEADFMKTKHITDTNFFHYYGKKAINLGVGYEHIHTNKEKVSKQSFIDLTAVLYEIVTH